MAQRYTSAGTSINSTKLPKAYRYEIPEGSTVIDYGCGRYTDHLRRTAEAAGLQWYGYDPYNRTADQNRDAEVLLCGPGADYVICSNVLNVIDADEAVDSVIIAAVEGAKVEAVFTVYEGDRSGEGRQTGADQYQRNETRSAYVDRIRSLGYQAHRRGEYIVVRK